MSGISVSPESLTAWNRAKWQAEEAIRGSGLDWTIVRGCWAYGPNDAALNRILHYSDYLPFVPIFGAGKRALTPGLRRGHRALLRPARRRSGKSGDTTFGLGGPDMVTLNEFLKLALRTMGRRAADPAHPQAGGQGSRER